MCVFHDLLVTYCNCTDLKLACVLEASPMNAGGYGPVQPKLSSGGVPWINLASCDIWAQFKNFDWKRNVS